MSIGAKGLTITIALFLFQGTRMPAVADAAYEVRTWREVSTRDVSPLGRAVMRGGGRSWTHLESARFYYHAAQPKLLPALVDEVEWCYDAVSEQLGLPALTEAGRLFVLDSPADWARVMRSAARMEAGVAMHVGNEIYLLRDAPRSGTYVDIPHEMVHFRLWQAYGRSLPLWLEEGLAVNVGWEVANGYQLTRQRRLYRDQPPLDPDTLIPWENLFSFETYPSSPPALASFYRQSAALVQALRAAIETERWPAFMEQTRNNERSLATTLILEYEWSEDDVTQLLNRITHQLISPQYSTHGR